MGVVSIKSLCLSLLLIFVLVQVATCISRNHPIWRQSLSRYNYMQKRAAVTASTYNGTIPTQWFNQTLDHFNDVNVTTWQQRYWINDEYWNPNLPGPIYIQLGEEAAAGSYYVTDFAMTEYGMTRGALLVGIEHRFYGDSQPTGDLSTKSLQYLSVDQALEDFGTIALAIREQYGPTSEIVVFGCSYIGAGAAWFRQRLPGVAVGAIASSAPVQATLDFFKYLDQVDLSISEQFGQNCDAMLKNATSDVVAGLQSASGTAKLMTLFNSCNGTQPASANDVATFFTNVIGAAMTTVQYDFEQPDNNVPFMCGTIANASSPLQGLANFVNISSFGQCMDISYDDTVEVLLNVSAIGGGIGYRQWIWQTCTEFGYFQTTDSNSQPFYEGNLVPLQYYVDLCQDSFPEVTMTNQTIQAQINKTNRRFMGNQIPSYGIQNTVFDDSIVDPWHTLSIQSSVNPSTPLLLYKERGHCAAALPSTPGDPVSVLEVRAKIEVILDSWMEVKP
eukprot:TRINITY_DN2873_c0_g1_i2.p1 TRINITY_DN2873_c0_g1~~TRINITY_DN2873_c0_g1_i2.p1  ORF type:complete len:559 (-),score=145.48 TRINITY_DN2873_c0_g1_i2:138-1646(-)